MPTSSASGSRAFVDSLHARRLSVPALDAIATCDSGQENWKLALVNRLPDQELACRIVVAGSPLEGIRQAVVLDGDGVDAYNDVDNPERVVPQEKPLAFSDGVANLPPHSVVILAL